MYKLASYSYDTLDHLVNSDLETLSGVVSGLSKTAQQAEIPDAGEREERPDSDFALILDHPQQGTMRKFATFTNEAIEININLLNEKIDELPQEIVKVAAANLGRAARDAGITVPKNLKQYVGDQFINNHVSVSNIDKTASYKGSFDDESNEHFALESTKKYPIDEPEQVKQAARYFKQHHRMFDLHEKSEYAENLYKRARILDIDIEDSMAEKYANLRRDRLNPDFEDHMKARKSYIADNEPEKKALYDEILQEAENLGPEKTAQALSEADKQTGTWTSWGKGLADPLMATFPMEKQAGEYVDGQFVTEEMLETISNEDMSAIAGNSSIRELKSPSGPKFLKKLPLPVRQEILDLIK